MTIETQASKVLYVGDGAAVTFPVPFPVHQAEHLRLYLSEALDREIVMETGYSVSGAGSGDVSVTLSAPLPTGRHLAIARLVPLTQRMDLENGGSFDAETIERQFDITEMQIQQLQEQVERTIKVPLTDGRDPDAFWLELLDASRAALEAYRNTLALADAQALDSYAVNVRRSALVTEDVPAGGVLILPASYYPRRNILYLAVDGMVCTPRRPDSADQSERQYDEIGDDANALSDRVLVHFPVEAGMLVDVWVITSNHENTMGELEGLVKEAEQSAQSAAASAQAAAQSVSEAGSEAQEAATAAQTAAQTAGEKAQEAAESAAGAAISANAAAASAAQAAQAAGGGADAIPDATESVTGKARFGTAAEHAAGAAGVAAVPEYVRDSIVIPALEAFAAENLVVATPGRAGFLPAGGLPGQVLQTGTDGESVGWGDAASSGQLADAEELTAAVTSSGIWVTPAEGKYAFDLFGGGGGGGGGGSGTGSNSVPNGGGGGGGGSGAHRRFIFSLPEGTEITITIGAGGAGGAINGGGYGGGETSIAIGTATYVAGGGGGGGGGGAGGSGTFGYGGGGGGGGGDGNIGNGGGSGSGRNGGSGGAGGGAGAGTGGASSSSGAAGRGSRAGAGGGTAGAVASTDGGSGGPADAISILGESMARGGGGAGGASRTAGSSGGGGGVLVAYEKYI